MADRVLGLLWDEPEQGEDQVRDGRVFYPVFEILESVHGSSGQSGHPNIQYESSDVVAVVLKCVGCVSMEDRGEREDSVSLRPISLPLERLGRHPTRDRYSPG